MNAVMVYDTLNNDKSVYEFTSETAAREFVRRSAEERMKMEPEGILDYVDDWTYARIDYSAMDIERIFVEWNVVQIKKGEQK